MSALLHDYISALSGGNYTHKNSDLLNNSYMDFILKPRPPAIGEEKEVESIVDCNASEKSTTRSHTTTGKQGSSSNSNSACLTPRKSKLSSVISTENNKNNHEIIAPLGFEPEGCSSKKDNFNETYQSEQRTAAHSNPVVPAMKWALSLANLLNDGEGVHLFRQFLAQQSSSNVLDFWFACQGLKLVPKDDFFMMRSLIRLIYRKYIRKEALGLTNATKREIVDRLRSNSIDTSIFEKAQQDIIEVLQQESYPEFLKSDLYMEFVRSSLEKSLKSTGNSSGSTESSASDPTKSSFSAMPTLHENTYNSKLSSINQTTISRAPISEAVSSFNIQSMKENWLQNHNSCKINEDSKYNVSYELASCLGSEVQSLSSDAHTDGYMSQNENIYQVERIHRHAPAKKKKVPTATRR